MRPTISNRHRRCSAAAAAVCALAVVPCMQGLNARSAAAERPVADGRSDRAPGPVAPAGDAAAQDHRAAGTCTPQWVPTFGHGPGIDVDINAFAVFDDGSGARLFAAGDSWLGVVVWDGASWSSIGSGILDPVHALAVFDDGTGPALYVGGEFKSAAGESWPYLVKWDGSTWSPVGGGTDGPVHALTVFDDFMGGGPRLYAGGIFHTAGGVPAAYLARWDGTSWSPVGGGADGPVFALKAFMDPFFGPGLVVGGAFQQAGGVLANAIARWNGTAWSAFHTGMNMAVRVLEVFDDGAGHGPALYAGGEFTTASGSVAATHIARWGGHGGLNQWFPMGNPMSGWGMNNVVRALAVYDDGTGPALYAGGRFTIAGGVAVSRVARWSGTHFSGTWSSVGGGVGDGSQQRVGALVPFSGPDGTVLYAGGYFTVAGGHPAQNVATWDGSAWDGLGSGLDSTVLALTVFDDGAGGGPALCAGGSFLGADGVLLNRIGRWDGAAWSPLGSGMNLSVFALVAVSENEPGGPALVAGGSFTNAGGVPANRIARWDGSAWSALGSGMTGAVLALAMFDDGSGAGPQLYAAGSFANAGGVPANRIARWDGSAWSPVGGGITSAAAFVYALTVHDDGSGGGPALYAGGWFTSAAGSPANFVAKWDGVQWSPLGSGVNSAVSAMHSAGGALYVAGSFTTAGGAPALRVARWEDGQWFPVGGGMPEGFQTVQALARFNDGTGDGPALYAGGTFTMTGDGPASRIARWDGSTWSSLGDGVDDDVFALTVFDDGLEDAPSLFVGGAFTGEYAGDSFLAKWSGCALPVIECLADLDGSGTVDFNDLLVLLGAWGPCKAPCPQDLDGSGVVDFNDLLELLGAWGSCEE